VHSRQASAAAVPVIGEVNGNADTDTLNGALERQGQGGAADKAEGTEGGAVGERPMFLEPRWKAAEKTGGGGGAFTQRELDEAVKRAEQRTSA
jgi:hypothetical protein